MNAIRKIFRLLYISSIIIVLTSCAEKQKETISSGDRMQWWTDAKFGLFIHWGVYSVPAGTYNGHQINGIGEWIMNNAKIPVADYKKFAGQFNPVKYNPKAWVKMAKDAGMKYLVITSKHHDGFALFDSKVTDWDVVDATPYGKDLLKPLAKACKKEGIRLGFYYSQAQDWNHPGGAASRRLAKAGWANPDSAKIDAYSNENRGHWDAAQEGSMDEYIDKIAVPQVKEILGNYGGLDILWWDTPTNMNKERAEKLLPLIKPYPDLITNNRLGGGYQGDTETPEQFIPATGYPGRHWEVCMTMNDTWGYKSYDDNWKSTSDLILKLSDIVSKGGNFLLNVGPTSEGEIPQPSIERLQQVGAWMKVNGDAIYGTTASPFPYLPWGKATRKGQKLYLHVISWPASGELKIPLRNKATKAYTLVNPVTSLGISQDGERVIVSVPSAPTDPILSVVAVEFEGEPDVLPIPSAGKAGSASSVDSTAAVANLFDGNPKNAWKPKSGENKGWVEVDLGEETTIENFSVVEPWRPWNNHGQEFQLQLMDGDKWVTVVEGKTNGCGHSQNFTPVKGRFFRLNITGANNEVPLLNEWILNRAI